MTRRGVAVLLAVVAIVVAGVSLTLVIYCLAEPYEGLKGLTAAQEFDRSSNWYSLSASIGEIVFALLALAMFALPPESLPRRMRPRPATGRTRVVAYVAIGACLMLSLSLLGNQILASEVASDKPWLQNPILRHVPIGLGQIAMWLTMLALVVGSPRRVALV